MPLYGPDRALLTYFSIVDADGTTTRNISAHLVSVEGIPGERALTEVTDVGDSGHRYVKGRFGSDFRLSGLYNKDVTTGLDTILNGLIEMSSATTFIYGPTGSTSPPMVPPNVVYKGSAWLKEYRVLSRVGSAIEFQVVGSITGTLTRHQGA